MDLGTAYLGKGTESLDVIAHEYTHIITRKYAKWSSGNRETGAINEGISDIFGEILAEAVGDGADWEMETESYIIHMRMDIREALVLMKSYRTTGLTCETKMGRNLRQTMHMDIPPSFRIRHI